MMKKLGQKGRKRRRRVRRRNCQNKKLTHSDQSKCDNSINKSNDIKQQEVKLYNNLSAMDTTTSINKMTNLRNGNKSENNTTGILIESSTNLNEEDAKLNINKNNMFAMLNLQSNQTPNKNNSNQSQIFNNIEENNSIKQNHKFCLNDENLLDNYYENYMQKPLCTSSPLYPIVKLNGDDRIINNKAYKDELNQQKLKTVNNNNNITYKTSSYKSQSLNSSSNNLKKENKLMNVSTNNLSEWNLDEHKIVHNSKLLRSKRKCNQSKTLSENFLHNINVNIISKIKRFNVRYMTKWVERIVSLYAWIGTLITRKDNDNNKVTTDHQNSLQYNKKQEEEEITLNDINNKIDKLASDLELRHKQTTELLAVLKTRFDRFEKKINDYDKIKSQLDEIQNKVNDIPQPSALPSYGQCQQSLVSSAKLAPPPPPPPLPPPPPPPPLPSLIPIPKININTSINNLKMSKSDKLGKEQKNDLHNRPVISEDALRQVKLRKVTDRPVNSRRQTEPFISKEMLCQIKLKPVNTRHKHVNQKGNMSESDNNISPGSNLNNRLMQVNTTMTRVNRLKKDRYSANFYDDSRNLRIIDRERSSMIKCE